MPEQEKGNKGPGDTPALFGLAEPTGLRLLLVVSARTAPGAGNPQSPAHLPWGVSRHGLSWSQRDKTAGPAESIGF